MSAPADEDVTVHRFIPRGLRRPTVAAAAMAIVIAFPLGVLASHQFSDVPNSNPFHGDIAAVANAGVTSGCGGGKFCPDRNVTRAEMAAFLNRLGALASNKTPVVNADRVDGLDSTVLLLGTAPIPAGATVTGYASYDHSVISDNTDVMVSVQLPAPAPVNLSSNIVNFAPHALAIDDDATCTGTAAAPTAPAGKVCLYIVQSANVDGGAGYDTEAAGFLNRGFLIQFFTNSASLGADLYFRVTWAYTAPAGSAFNPGADSQPLSKE
jgi:hypothetical protein